MAGTGSILVARWADGAVLERIPSGRELTSSRQSAVSRLFSDTLRGGRRCPPRSGTDHGRPTTDDRESYPRTRVRSPPWMFA